MHAGPEHAAWELNPLARGPPGCAGSRRHGQLRAATLLKLMVRTMGVSCQRWKERSVSMRHTRSHRRAVKALLNLSGHLAMRSIERSHITTVLASSTNLGKRRTWWASSQMTCGSMTSAMCGAMSCITSWRVGLAWLRRRRPAAVLPFVLPPPQQPGRPCTNGASPAAPGLWRTCQ